MTTRFFAVEVIQTSVMDCGPASLKCLLEGHGIPVSYGRLREACQTDLDGTSIDTLEAVANRLGLVARQEMIPADHVLTPGHHPLPALVVIRRADGLPHFVVAWRRLGDFVQVMDPGSGRVWMRSRTFIESLYLHTQRMPARAWRTWAASERFCVGLRARMAELGIARPAADALVDRALEEPGWEPMAALDAAVRLVRGLCATGGVGRGTQAVRAIRSFADAHVDPDSQVKIPTGYFSALPSGEVDGEPWIGFRAAVMLRVDGRSGQEAQDLSRELQMALHRPQTHAAGGLLQMLARDGVLVPSAILGAMGLSAGAIVIQALLFRGLLDLAVQLGVGAQRLGAIVALLIFLAATTLLEVPIGSGAIRLGRHLEGRFRVAFLEKLPRLRDRYFQSRLTSDMVERSHRMHSLRVLPVLGANLMQACAALGFTALGVAVLDPWVAPLAVLTAIASVVLPLVVQPLFHERDLRARTHSAALSRFYLDAMLGLVPVRTHGADRALRREHEGLLTDWAEAVLGKQRAVIAVETVLSLAGNLLAIVVLVAHLWHGGTTGTVLLLVFWALALPSLGREVGGLARAYPAYRNVALRLLEPLDAPEDDGPPEGIAAVEPLLLEDQPTEELGDEQAVLRPVHLAWQGVTVRAAGHTILDGVDLTVEPGEHLAIVGPSGAGKSTLVGLLLGWHVPVQGVVRVDGRALFGPELDRVRRHTAWVDPAVQLWNRSLLENLRYGNGVGDGPRMGAALDAAALDRVLDRLPSGLQTVLGEGGALVSGGEGQRVRLARSMLRSDVRLVILDEPFRGLDRPQRAELLARAREWWSDATLLVVTHDLGETEKLPRVVVVDGGRVVEDGAPVDLLARDTRYRALHDAEDAVRKRLWSSAGWRRIWLQDGQLRERS